MPLYPEAPQGVLTPGFMDLDTPFGMQQAPDPSAIMTGPPVGAPDLPSVDALGPQAPETKRPGLLGRIRQQPGGSKALIALGASLLTAPTFQQGLGQGALAFQNTLDAEADKLKPQLTKDSTFTYRRNPVTGQLEFNKTPVADWEDAQQLSKLQASLGIAKLRDQGDTQRLETSMGYRDKWDQRQWDYKGTELQHRDQWNQDDNKTAEEVARINGENAWKVASAKIGATGDKPPPVGIQKQISEFTQTRDAQSNAISQIEPILGAIDRGDLSFSLPSNLRHKAAIATGIGGNQETVFYSQYLTTLESLRNALLVANKGVQTDGDAERAMAELIAGGGNTQTVKANLTKVLTSLRNRAAQSETHIDDLARQYHADVSSRSPGVNTAPRGHSAPVRSGSTNGVKWRLVD
jgi:hypothetical protein